MSDHPDKKDLIAWAKSERRIFERFSQQTCDRMLAHVAKLEADLKAERAIVERVELLPEMWREAQTEFDVNWSDMSLRRPERSGWDCANDVESAIHPAPEQSK